MESVNNIREIITNAKEAGGQIDTKDYYNVEFHLQKIEDKLQGNQIKIDRLQAREDNHTSELANLTARTNRITDFNSAMFFEQTLEGQRKRKLCNNLFAIAPRNS